MFLMVSLLVRVSRFGILVALLLPFPMEVAVSTQDGEADLARTPHISSPAYADTNSSGICPFDDLTADEIRLVLRVIRKQHKHRRARGWILKYPIIRALEAPKEDWLKGREYGRRRRAFAAVFDEKANQLIEFVIELHGGRGRITSVKSLRPGITPPIMSHEYDQAEEIVRASPKWVSALRRRGLRPEKARLDIWVPGTLSGSSKESVDVDKGNSTRSTRILRVITNYQDPASRFWYWAVVEGLTVDVDLQAGVVVSVWDDEALDVLLTTGIEEDESLFDEKPQLKPLHISQPEGSSIVVDGQQISWYKWRFRYSVDPIHGLQLYHLTYSGDCAQRSVIYKLSLAEIFVPYGAQGRAWRWRSALDVGEYGLGKKANPLTVGVDVPENSLLFDCVMADDEGGDPKTIRGCVAAYERDYGLLYKHTDTKTGDVDGRRGRSLVLMMMATIGNYDYAFEYVFQQDGQLEPRIRLTGIVLARGVKKRVDDPNCITSCSNLLNDYLLGPVHQHFFNYRIDFDVDGTRNHLLEVDLVADAPGPENPDTGAFSTRRTIVEHEGYRDHDFNKHRTWHVVNANPEGRNRFGSPRGDALRPETVSFTYLTDANPVLAHAQFVKHPIWVTKYKDDEQTASSIYPRTGEPNEGLPEYVRDAEGLENEDIVVWYTHGITHSPRPEEWPIMNAGHQGSFVLFPFNFLSQNSEMPLKGRCA